MRTLNLSLSEGAIKRMTLKVENDWSNPLMYSGVERELLGSVYSLVNVPVQVWKAIQDFMIQPLAEPKEFGAMVEAGIEGWVNRVPMVNINGRWWTRNNLHWSWSELIEPKRIENPK